MNKTFTRWLAVLASVLLVGNAWAETTVTFSASEIASGTKKSGITPYTSQSAGPNTICNSKESIVELSSSADANYNTAGSKLRVSFSVAEGQGTIKSIVVKGATNQSSAQNAAYIYWDAPEMSSTYTGAELVSFPAASTTGICDDYNVAASTIPTGTKCVSMYKRVKINESTKAVGSGSNYGSGQTIRIAEVTITLEPECSNPNASFTAAATSTYVGDEVALTFSSDNTNTVSYAVSPSTGSVTDGKFTATAAGEYTITATQAADDTHCAVSEELTISVSTKDPASISALQLSKTNAFIGETITATVTATGATSYEWYVNNEKTATTTEPTYEYTPDAAGTYTFACVAKGTYGNDETKAKTASAEVTKVCGMLIKAELTSGSAATVTGVLGGSASVSLSSKKKLDSGKYFGITLASGTFTAGDEVTINVATVADQGKVALYADKEMTTVVYQANDFGTAGDNTFTLGSAANGLKTLWIARDANGTINKWNPILNSISVTRSCEESSDATLSDLTVDGTTVEGFDAATTSYDVELSYDVTTVPVVAYTVNHPLATAVATQIDALPEGDGVKTATVVVTAENGDTKTYTINFTKAAAASTDATLKTLTVGGKAITLVEGTYDYTCEVAYGTTAVPTTTAETNDANATVVVTNAADLDGTTTVVVTAQDGTTTQTYRVTFTMGNPILQQVIFTNGFDAFINNSKVEAYYMNDEDAPTIKSVKVAGVDEADVTFAISEGKVVLTIDEKQYAYDLMLEAVAPCETYNTTITFDGTESWIKGGYGYKSDKGWAFQKTDDDWSRETPGKTRIYFFIGKANTATLEWKVSRAIKVYNCTLEEGKVEIGTSNELTNLNSAKNNLIEIVSNQTSGDGGFKAILIDYTESKATNLNEAAADLVLNGNIIRNASGMEARLYDVQGRVVMSSMADLDLALLPQGLYIARCGGQSLKVVK